VSELTKRCRIDGLDLKLTRKEWDELECVLGVLAPDVERVTAVRDMRGDIVCITFENRPQSAVDGRAAGA